MQYEFNGTSYDMLHIQSNNYKEHEEFLETVGICDREIIDKDLEDLELSALQDPGMYGFFISNDKFENLLAFVIIDVDCKNSSKKIKFSDYGLNIKKCIEISLFCSNQAIRIRGLATSFLQSILENSSVLKPGCTTAVGVPANRNLAKLLDFYVNHLKFEIVESTPKFTIIQRDIHVPRGEAAAIPEEVVLTPALVRRPTREHVVSPSSGEAALLTPPRATRPKLHNMYTPDGGKRRYKRTKRKKIKRRYTRNYSFT